MTEHPNDICECGDYRCDHPDDGPCNLNGLVHGIPGIDSYAGCFKFRLSQKADALGDTRGEGESEGKG